MQSVHTINRKTKSISRKRLVARFLNLVLFNLFLSFFTSSQTIHPVTTAVQLVPPYSVYLPDYAAPGTDKLRVILTLNDITQSSYPVKLAIKVELNGLLILQTDPAFQPQPIVLLPGQPVIISGAALSDYLSSVNLQFSGGFSRDNYERTKALPEGAYKISFTAYDYTRQVQVSNEGYNVFFFKKSEPPVLNLPFHKSRVEGKQPQFLTFSWSDRNTPALQGGAWSRPSYRFELFEVRPAGSNPEYIVRSSKPLFSMITEATTLIYGPAEPLLQDSMEYVWRVQAIDREGRDAYSNGGYSGAYLFTYGGQDPFLVNNIGRPALNGEALSERSGRWSWNVSNQSKVEGWKIQYRKSKVNGQQSTADIEQWTWNTEETTDTVFSLFNLEASTTYEARVQARVKGIYGPWSDIAQFHTSPKRVFECGQPYDKQPLDNAQPLQVATAGMIVRVGDFDMQLLQVEGSSGFFSGYGAVTTPLLGFRVNVKFTGIGINDKLIMTSGEVVALSEPLEEWIKKQNQYFRGGGDVGKVVTGDIKPTFRTELDILSESAIRYDSISQTITITGSDGTTTKTIDVKGKTFPLIIQDKDEELYQVDQKGKVQKLGKRNSQFAQANTPESLNRLQQDKGIVTFTAGPDNRYGFDSWKEAYTGKTVLEASYENLAGGSYRVPVKALVPGATETVLATLVLKDNSIKAEDVQFITAKGIAYPFERSGNQYTITLTGGPAGDGQELFAVYATDSTHYITLGKLLVVSYAAKSHKVVLVPVGGASIHTQAVSQQLNQIFNPIGISYEVVEDESFRGNKTWDTNNNGLLDVSPSALFSNGATGEMKALVKAYRNSHTLDKQTPYVFVLEESSKEGLLGEMARGEQFGYVFSKGASEESVGRTLAHELGHGRYKLEHTFNGGIGLAKGSTDNLMDYAGGSNLVKYQWDAIHDPGHVWGVLEKDKESESHDINIEALLKWIKENKGKKALFKRDDYFSTSFKEKAWVDIALYFDYNGKQHTAYAEVYDDGEVDFELNSNNTFSAFEVRIDHAATLHTGFKLSVRYANSTKLAFTLWTYSWEDYQALLKKLAIALPEASQNVIAATYQAALKEAGSDCNKLDVIYENLPDCVADKISDEDKWLHLQSLSKCLIDKVGTNEQKAIVNLFKGISPTYLQTQVNEAPAFFMELYNHLGDSWRTQLIIASTQVLSQVWTGEEALKTVYPEETLVADNALGQNVVSCFRLQAKELAFASSYFYKCANGWYSEEPCYGGVGTQLFNFNAHCIGQYTLAGSAPVVMTVEGKQLVVPAFIAGQIMTKQIKESYRQFIGLNVGLLLPEVLIKPATLAKWSRFFGKGTSAIENLLDDVYQAQKAIVNQWKNSIANASNLHKGNFGEIVSDVFLTEKGFEPLHTRIIEVDAFTHQGIDGVFKKGNEYFIVEAKYKGSATLSTLSDGTKQMSDAWIRGGNRLLDAVGGDVNLADDIIDLGYKRLLAEVAPDGSVVYKELDASANVIRIFNP